MSEHASKAILADLVGFPTVSRDSNLDLIAYARDYLAAHGIACELFHNPEKTKANLFATIGPNVAGGIVLSGHTDVVPVDGQRWTVDPFRLTERAGRLYGRGTADMKGFIASALAAVPAFLASPLRTPVHLALSFDEEVGCLGVRHMLRELATRKDKPRLCLIGEPTELVPALGHKGKLAMRCRVHGLACHSAYAPSGVNAIEFAARAVVRLQEIGQELSGPACRDPRFDPPFTTIQTGLIRGGAALNIVPQDCEFDFEVRALPDFKAGEVVSRLSDYAASELLPRMRRVSESARIDLEHLGEYPGLATDPDSDAARLLAELAGSSDFGTVAFGTEGGLFQQAGIPTVVCGPGSMAQGHKPDEFISVEQLEACDRMMERVAGVASSAAQSGQAAGTM